MRRINLSKQSVIKKSGPAITLLLVISILTSLSGCGPSKKDAQALVKAGSETSDQVAKYYESLIKQDTDYLTILSYTVAPKFSDSEKKVLAKERRAYVGRADLAHKLKAAYDALGKLIDYDASTEVKGAVGDLLTSVLKQVPHPGELDSDLFKTVVGKVAGKLAEIQQEKQFRKNAPRILEVLDGVSEIFEMERPLYAQTAKLYEDEAAKYARSTLGNETCGTAQTTGFGALEKFIEPYSLKYYPVNTTDSYKCKQNYNYFKGQIDELEHDRKVAAMDQARKLSTALYSLERTHRDFLHAKPNAPSLLPSDLTDVSKLVASLNDAINERDAWEKQHSKEKMTEDFVQVENDEEKPSYVPAKNFVSDHIATVLSPAVTELIKKGGKGISSDGFRKMLLDDLNRIIETDDIFEAILSNQGRKNLDDYRAYVLVSEVIDGHLSSVNSNETRKKLRHEIADEVGAKLAADRAQFTGMSSPPDEDLKRQVLVDPAAKSLAILNRAILTFVYNGVVHPIT